MEMGPEMNRCIKDSKPAGKRPRGKDPKSKGLKLTIDIILRVVK